MPHHQHIALADFPANGRGRALVIERLDVLVFHHQ
jgi:hypothetical protein